MTKKTRIATAIIICLIVAAAICFAGCSDGASDSAAPASSGSAFTGDKYVSEEGGLLETSQMPDGYEFVPNDKFEAAFKALVDGTVSSYAEVAEAFGAKGFRCKTPDEFADAMKQAMALGGPVWIECEIDREEKVLPMIPSGGTVHDTKFN